MFLNFVSNQNKIYLNTFLKIKKKNLFHVARRRCRGFPAVSLHASKESQKGKSKNNVIAVVALWRSIGGLQSPVATTEELRPAGGWGIQLRVDQWHTWCRLHTMSLEEK